MWIIQNDSFLSIVEHKGKPGHLLVRARVKGDIENAIPTANVYEDASADYFFRADISREDLKTALVAAVDKINYGNFKASVKDHARHEAYMGVWGVLARAFGAYGKS